MRAVMLHAHELLVRRVTIDGHPARVVRRGRVVARPPRPEGEETGDDEGRDDETDLGTRMETGLGMEGAGEVKAGGSAAAADGAQHDALVAATGEGDELVIELCDGGIIASAATAVERPPAPTLVANPAPPTAAAATAAAATAAAAAAIAVDPPAHPPSPPRLPPPQRDVVVCVWYAAGPAVGRPGAPPGSIPNVWNHLALSLPTHPRARPTTRDQPMTVGQPPSPPGDEPSPPSPPPPSPPPSQPLPPPPPEYHGWSVPGFGAVSSFVDPEDPSCRFAVCPGPALRPAAWFPCVDDGRAPALPPWHQPCINLKETSSPNPKP